MREPLSKLKTIASKRASFIYPLIVAVFGLSLLMIPIIALAVPGVPSNVIVDRQSASNTALTVSWNNTGLGGGGSGNRVWANGTIMTSFLTTATNVTYNATGLAPGVNYNFKIGAYDNTGYTDWSFPAAAITKTSASATSFGSPHASFFDTTNMCAACHSVHKAKTKFKALKFKYSELTSEYSTNLSTATPQQSLPGVDMCFNCHDGSGANYNVKKHYDQPTSATVPFPGHWTKTASTNTSGYGFRPIVGLPAKSRLPCMTCHDTHVSTLNNWKMMADDLYRYSKMGVANSAAYGKTYGGPWPTGAGIPDETNNDQRITSTDSLGTAWEKCTVCHHRAGSNTQTDSVMVVAGIDINFPTASGQTDHSDKTSGCGCHISETDIDAKTNVHALGSKPGVPQPSCGQSASCHPDVTARMMSSAFVSRHYLTADTNQDQPSTNADRCTSKCHNNHGQRTPQDSYNLYTNAVSLSGTANYDYTAAPSANAPGLCLSCHQSTRPSPITTSNGTKTVSAISPTPFAQSAHSYPTANYVTKSGRTYTMTCLKCHMDSDQSTDDSKWGPHASANRSLLYKSEEAVCLDCHEPIGKDTWANRTMATVAWKISTAFSQTYKHDINSTGTSNRHLASEGGSPFWMTSGYRHVTCYDCHNPHEATQGYNYNASLPFTGSANTLETPTQGVVSGPLRGVWGVYPTTAWSSIPTAAIYTDSYNSTTPIGRLFYTESAQKQAYICLKCHSSYAYGTRAIERPLVPSGVPSGAFAAPPSETPLPGRQSDILAAFNPNNIGYHPVFAPGKNQPPLTAAWTKAMGRNSVAYDPEQSGAGKNPGLTTSFVPPWGASSLVTCSNCHSNSSASYSRGYYTSAASVVNAWDFPRGPHGSSRRWILARLDRSIRYLRNDSTSYDYANVTADAVAGLIERNFCLNCHRADVYWGGGTQLVVGISRVNHIPGIGANSTHIAANRNMWGIVCMTCHAGIERGVIHGTGGAPPGLNAPATSPPRGRRLIYGATWTGYSTAYSGNYISCGVEGSAPVSDCSRGLEASTKTGDIPNYSY